jgi:O-antigen/teichoic acid export membrane protein
VRDKVIRLFWLMTDQGVFALSNFVLNVQFARWLSPHDYGLFAISFTGFLLLSVVHYGCLLEPLLVLSARVGADRRGSYLMALVHLHLLLFGSAIALCTLALMCAWGLGQPEAGWLIVGAGIGGSTNLALLTARRLCLIFLTTRLSALVGTIYLLGVTVTSYLCILAWSVSWFAIWEIIGAWSLVCATLVFGLLIARVKGRQPFSLSEVLKFQARYAPFTLIGAVGTWVTAESIMIFLAKIQGLEAVAETRVIFNVASPLVQITIAMNAFWLVGFSAKHANREQHGIANEAMPYLAVCVLGALFAQAAGAPLMDFLYRGKYVGVAWQLPIYCLAIGIAGLTQIVGSSFKARGQLFLGNLPQIVCGAATLMASIPLMQMFGQPGAIYTNFIGNATGLVIAVLLLAGSRMPGASNSRNR